MTSSDWVQVDDADPRIQYSSGWQSFVNGSELDGTKHGAAAAGLTASFTFTGTQVIVVGSLGSVDVHGIPTTLYALDGAEAGLYTAPVIAPGLFQLNVTFFSSKSLAPGDHTLVITNVNGTSPNVFWLDYVEYIASAPSTTTTSTSFFPSQSLTGSGSTAPTSNSPEPPTTPQSPITSTTAAPKSSGTSPSNSNASTSTSHNHTGAIAGGIVGGVALTLAIALLLVYLRRRKKGANTFNADPPIRPFGSWRSPDEAQIDPPNASPPSQKQMSMSMTAGTSTPTLSATLAMTTAPTLAGLSPAPSARVPSPATTERVPSSGPASSRGAGRQAAGSEGQPPQVTQLVDSGLRLPGEEAVILPPPYSRE